MLFLYFAKKDIDKMFQPMKTLGKESKEREEQFQKAKRNFAEVLTNCTVKLASFTVSLTR